jgi:hypothetical protein
LGGDNDRLLLVILPGRPAQRVERIRSFYSPVATDRKTRKRGVSPEK